MTRLDRLLELMSGMGRCFIAFSVLALFLPVGVLATIWIYWLVGDVLCEAWHVSPERQRDQSRIRYEITKVYWTLWWPYYAWQRLLR